MAGRWPFVGRARELARARALRDGGTGVLLLGEPGIGKTALARELVAGTDAEVRHVTGHASSRAPFEAFGGVLTGSDGDELDVPEVAARLSAALGTRDGRPALLVVDDIQLLDLRSTQVLLQVASEGSAVVIATAPAGARLPEPVHRLWRDGLCERMDLRPLTGDDVVELLEAVLGGPLDRRGNRTFTERSGGNPLLLRELVEAALDDEALVRGDIDGRGVWTLLRDPPVSSGTREIVALRLAQLPEAQRAALETVAAGEPMPLRLAADLIGDDVLDDLAGQRLIVVRAGLAGPEVVTGHPLYGEVLRADLAPLRLHRLRLSVARGLESTERPTPHDLVRAALWRLDSGQGDEPDRLLTAARAARTLNLQTAERLARHAAAASGSPAATLLLAEILTHAGRTAEAAALTAALPPDGLAIRDREAIAYCTAMGQGLLVGDPGGGADLVAAVIAGVPAASDQLRALHGALLAFDARFASAYDIAAPIAENPAADPVARTLGAIGAIGALYWLGRLRDAVAMADRLTPVAVGARATVPFGAPSLSLLAICALLEHGDLDDAQRRAVRMREQADADDDPFAGPRADYVLARCLLLRGQAGPARRLFARCMAGVSPFDQFMTRPLGAMLARAAATCGDVPAAHAALASVADGTRMKTYEPEYDLAEAATLAADLQLAAAGERAAWAAGVAADQGQWSIAVAGYHDAARYGVRHVLVPMREAAAHVEGSLARCLADSATALAGRDADALDDIARRFETLGVLPFAAEAAAAAAHGHAAAGRPRAARASGARATELAARCDAPVPPWLAGAATAVPLTVRERQVAVLAASGATDAAIAARLGISIRTVQTHLAHVYDKLGARRRSDLRIRLGDDPAP